jgi:hypothetical protein
VKKGGRERWLCRAGEDARKLSAHLVTGQAEDVAVQADGNGRAVEKAELAHDRGVDRQRGASPRKRQSPGTSKLVREGGAGDKTQIAVIV